MRADLGVLGSPAPFSSKTAAYRPRTAALGASQSSALLGRPRPVRVATECLIAGLDYSALAVPGELHEIGREPSILVGIVEVHVESAVIAGSPMTSTPLYDGVVKPWQTPVGRHIRQHRFRELTRSSPRCRFRLRGAPSRRRFSPLAFPRSILHPDSLHPATSRAGESGRGGSPHGARFLLPCAAALFRRDYASETPSSKCAIPCLPAQGSAAAIVFVVNATLPAIALVDDPALRRRRRQHALRHRVRSPAAACA